MLWSLFSVNNPLVQTTDLIVEQGETNHAQKKKSTIFYGTERTRVQLKVYKHR